ncbi:hypothetical protein ROLI_046220 (plasmid) [Roseobacter fucihabitans]|uniref:VPLPA-CTERM sorting domain-containing protein n=1 Tax=Roseobacter fucihabitans TaxID=1537242 RepID=A0ABZ2C2I5_9RHOB|nr:VPLPA-CTERM sorting domain-containing protein [Roseobacter litoralis]MBC6966910.1 hypothetical protein [Roseobacter litoralis]
MKKSILTAASAMAILAAGTASAITYNITDTVSIPSGGIGNPFVTDYEAAFGAGNVGFGLVQSADASALDTSVGFSYAFSSSRFENLFTFGSNSIDEAGNTAFIYTDGVATFTGTDMEFTVVTGSGSPPPADAALGDIGFGIFYDLTETNNTVFLAFADRASEGDSDYSDHVIQTSGTVNVVPLPAAAWMLLAGIGGLVSMRRRKS